MDPGAAQNPAMSNPGLVCPSSLPPMNCKICGQEYSFHYHECDELRIMKRDGICFFCAFWKHKIETQADDPMYFRTSDWEAYYIGRVVNVEAGEKPRPTAWGRGFGGRTFKIKLLNPERTIVTDDLWHGGTVPEWARPRLPINGEILE